MIFVLVAVTVTVVVGMLAAGERETKIGPLRDAPGPGRRDRRPLAPVVVLEVPVAVELVETRVEIRGAAHA